MSLLKAALKRADLPKIEVFKSADSPIPLPGNAIEKVLHYAAFAEHLDKYHLMHGWYQETMHPCYPQVLGLSLQLDLLLGEQSPFPLLGLVHLGNHINVLAPMKKADLTLSANLSMVKHHRKGLLVLVTVTMRQQQEVVCVATGEYLYRCSMPSEIAAQESDSAPIEPLDPHYSQTQFDLSSAIGRQYAAISGDYNPIHLWPLSAKLFGFPRNIAHGMHTLAMAVSVMEKHWQSPFTANRIDATFMAAALLPQRVDLRLDAETNRFELHQAAKQLHKQLVLSGQVTAL